MISTVPCIHPIRARQRCMQKSRTEQISWDKRGDLLFAIATADLSQQSCSTNPNRRDHTQYKSDGKQPPIPTHLKEIKLPSSFETQCRSLRGQSMQPSWSLQLLMLTFSSLISLTSCHPRPHNVPAVNAASNLSGSIRAAENSVRNNGPTDALIVKSLKRRSLGFHDFIDIGIGWNMYYSSWPAVALPVRMYLHIKHLPVYSRNVPIQKDSAIANSFWPHIPPPLPSPCPQPSPLNHPNPPLIPPPQNPPPGPSRTCTPPCCSMHGANGRHPHRSTASRSHTAGCGW